MISEALIAFAEVPKVALFRVLVALMAVLWGVEWGLQGGLSPGLGVTGKGLLLRPSRWPGELVGWLGRRPTGWVVLAVVAYLVSILLSAGFSASFQVSMWGEVPGQDGNAVYTLVAYVTFFGVVAAHLKTRPQVWRVLGAIVSVGVAVSGYAVLQHHGLDFLGLTEPTGGALARVTGTQGNAIFVASVLMLTIGISLAAATIALLRPGRPSRLWWMLLFWVPVLAVQLLGIIYTFSRGPWLGAVVAMALFLVLVFIFVGWRAGVRSWLPLGVVAALAVLVILWSGGATAGKKLVTEGRLASIEGTTTAKVVQRLTEPEGTVGSKSLSARVEYWQGSWQLILHHPWFEFDHLRWSFWRPLIGYGPDLFRYTYALVSPPTGSNLVPRWPYNAHNYFLNQGVELGFLGLLSSVSLFVSLFLVGAYQVQRYRRNYSVPHTLLLMGLLAIMAGRCVEQMVGLARISDLTIYWALLALFVALPKAMDIQRPGSPQFPASHSQRGSRRSFSASPRGPWCHGLRHWRAAVVACLIVGIAAVTWLKAVNYPLAAREAARADQFFRNGDPQTGLQALKRASGLAPDVSVYHAWRASVYSLYARYLNDPRVARERECDWRDKVKERAYAACLADQAYLSEWNSVKQSPLDYRWRLALADRTLSRVLDGEAELAGEAIRLHREVVAQVPNSWPLLNRLAGAYIRVGQPKAALQTLERSQLITGGTAQSASSFRLAGIAFHDLGDLGKAVESLERSLELDPSSNGAKDVHRLLVEVYTAMGAPALADMHRLLYEKIGGR
jgi:O-antigen ligase/Tfp pilus assembly protein PilF